MEENPTEKNQSPMAENVVPSHAHLDAEHKNSDGQPHAHLDAEHKNQDGQHHGHLDAEHKNQDGLPSTEQRGADKLKIIHVELDEREKAFGKTAVQEKNILKFEEEMEQKKAAERQQEEEMRRKREEELFEKQRQAKLIIEEQENIQRQQEEAKKREEEERLRIEAEKKEEIFRYFELKKEWSLLSEDKKKAKIEEIVSQIKKKLAEDDFEAVYHNFREQIKTEMPLEEISQAVSEFCEQNKDAAQLAKVISVIEDLKAAVPPVLLEAKNKIEKETAAVLKSPAQNNEPSSTEGKDGSPAKKDGVAPAVQQQKTEASSTEGKDGSGAKKDGAAEPAKASGEEELKPAASEAVEKGVEEKKAVENPVAAKKPSKSCCNLL